MSKYTDEELAEMALTYLEAQKGGDVRWIAVCAQVSLSTGLSPTEVNNRITDLLSVGDCAG